METVVWYLANPDGSDWDTNYYVHLTDFSDGGLIVPLFVILLQGDGDVSSVKVYDKTVYRDPQLDARPLPASYELLEIKRVNPELVRLLAGISEKEIDTIALQWFSDPVVREQANEDEAEARRMLTELRKLAKASLEHNKEIMLNYYWCN